MGRCGHSDRAARTVRLGRRRHCRRAFVNQRNDGLNFFVKKPRLPKVADQSVPGAPVALMRRGPFHRR